jgi:hypothetical protein
MNARLPKRAAQLVVLASVAALVLVGAHVSAAGAAELEVSGSFTATGTLSTDGCTVFRQVVDGDGDWTGLGQTTLHLDFCTAYVPTENWPVLGTFSLSSDAGTLTGDLGGTVKAGTQTPDGFPFTFQLTVTGASGDLADATGTLALEGFFGFGALTAHGTVAGTLTVPPLSPADTGECMNGGWRELVDDQGRPFANQGLCIAWVNRPA